LHKRVLEDTFEYSLAVAFTLHLRLTGVIALSVKVLRLSCRLN
jgi:hypothetical protein